MRGSVSIGARRLVPPVGSDHGLRYHLDRIDDSTTSRFGPVGDSVIVSDAYIVAAVRTAGGRKNGRLKDWHPVDLAATLLDSVVVRARIEPAAVEDVILGCVTLVGEQAHNIARQAVLASQLPQTVPGVTLDRACGSSQQALHFAAQTVMSGCADVVIAGGIESMTRAPMMSAYTLAMEKGLGTPMSPGLARRLPGYSPNQFAGAEMLGEKYEISKADCDEYALESHCRAAAATRAGRFREEILPLQINMPDGTGSTHDVDEGIRFDATLDSIRAVKLLNPGGRITAASSSQICDGASAVVLASEIAVSSLGLTPLARVHHMSVLGGDPTIMLETPIQASQRALERTGMSIADIDLYEVNEAFATVPLAWAKAIGADPSRMNVNGGALALGHPMGASGTKLATTLIHALRATRKRFGLQTMCEAGGMANVTIFEAL
jgi:acetyl-CoA C-acetyltransferase